MSAFDASIRALTDALLDAILHSRWDEADADLETLAQEAADAIARNRPQDLAVLARWTARNHTILDLRDGLGPEAMHRLGQVKAIALVIAAGRDRKHPRPAATLAEAGTPMAALLAGLEATARTGQALSAVTGLKPDVVARLLPELRAAGLVRSWPAGRLVVNALTEDGRRLCQARGTIPAAACLTRITPAGDLPMSDKPKDDQAQKPDADERDRTLTEKEEDEAGGANKQTPGPVYDV